MIINRLNILSIEKDPGKAYKLRMFLHEHQGQEGQSPSLNFVQVEDCDFANSLLNFQEFDLILQSTSNQEDETQAEIQKTLDLIPDLPLIILDNS